MPTDTQSTPEITTLAEWKNVLHDPVLPSGRQVVYRDVSLVELAKLDELPDDLLELVVAEWVEPGSALRTALEPLADLPDKPTKKQAADAEKKVQQIVERISAINKHVVALALVEPKATIEDLDEIPLPDLEMLSNLINRRTVTDAVGRHVGVVPLDSFRTVLEAHGLEQCPADCPACQEARRAVAAVR